MDRMEPDRRPNAIGVTLCIFNCAERCIILGSDKNHPDALGKRARDNFMPVFSKGIEIHMRMNINELVLHGSGKESRESRFQSVLDSYHRASRQMLHIFFLP